MTLRDELAQVASGVQEQVAVQIQPGVRSLVVLAAPDGTFVVAHNFEPERLIKVLQRALDSAKAGRKGSGLLWLPPGVRS